MFFTKIPTPIIIKNKIKPFLNFLLFKFIFFKKILINSKEIMHINIADPNLYRGNKENQNIKKIILKNNNWFNS